MILLDTHVWIWLLADRSQLSQAASVEISQRIESERSGSICVSAISVWELFMLVKKGRLSLSVSAASFVSRTRGDPTMRILPVDEAIARRSVELPDHHADPADRIILATAFEHGLPIVTRDAQFGVYGADTISA